jgi:hypothetical protein
MQNPTVDELARAVGLPPSALHLQEDEDKSDIRTFYLSVHQNQIVPALQAVMARYQITDMGIEEQSLEHVIQKLYEGDSGSPRASSSTSGLPSP